MGWLYRRIPAAAFTPCRVREPWEEACGVRDTNTKPKCRRLSPPHVTAIRRPPRLPYGLMSLAPSTLDSPTHRPAVISRFGPTRCKGDPVFRLHGRREWRTSDSSLRSSARMPAPRPQWAGWSERAAPRRVAEACSAPQTSRHRRRVDP